VSRRRPTRRRPAAQGSAGPSLRGGAQRLEEHPDGAWYVRQVTGAASTKPYRCPGCQQVIAPATPHVVAWPQVPNDVTVADGLEERRHWHTACWRARGRRR
jgi:hypothetical protein